MHLIVSLPRVIVARLNIEYLRKRLANEPDETKRDMILRLLAEEEAKLAALNSQQEKRHR
jgi:hypothetical protein